MAHLGGVPFEGAPCARKKLAKPSDTIKEPKLRDVILSILSPTIPPQILAELVVDRAQGVKIQKSFWAPRFCDQMMFFFCVFRC